MNRSQFLKILVIAVVVLIAAVGAVWYFSFGHCLTMPTTEKERCWTRLNDFFKKQEPVNLRSRTSIDKFIKFCDDFQTCQPALFCGADGADDINRVNHIRGGCDAASFYSTTNLTDCWELIEKRNSNCLQNWYDFGTYVTYYSVGPSTRPDVLARKRECDSFIGMNGCLKMEMVETCGEKTWKHYREFMTSNDQRNSVCDWSQLD